VVVEKGSIAMRTRNGRVSIELARRREQVAFDLAVKGLSESQIAEELAQQGLGEVTQQAVSKMLLRIEKRMLAEMNDKIREKKIRHEAILWKIVQESLASWHESKKPQKSLTTKHGPSGVNGEPGKVMESNTTLRDQDGDPRYLDQARSAMADIRKIWGVDEPAHVKSDVSGSIGLGVMQEIIEVVVTTRKQAEEVLAHLSGPSEVSGQQGNV
jgi:hypothetical protein